MVVNLPLFGDGAGNAGWSSTDSAVTKLYRNDELLGESLEPGYGRFVLPQGSARYRLTAEASRTGYPLTTKVFGTWTFQADRGIGVAQHPVSVIRYTPKLSPTGTAPVGSIFVVPISVQTQAGVAAHARLQSVDVSYDSGASWQPAPVFGEFALLYHPASATTVSLRGTASDPAGNSVEQTIIDAYLLS
jgi:hypothetical protein